MVGCELVYVGVTGLLLCPAGGEEGVHELSDELAGVGGELAAFLGGGLVVAERGVDLPVDVLDRGEWVGCAEHLGAVFGESDLDSGWVLAVDRGEAVRVKPPPQSIVRALEALLGCVEPSRQRGVLAELGGELRCELPDWIRDAAASGVDSRDRL